LFIVLTPLFSAVDASSACNPISLWNSLNLDDTALEIDAPATSVPVYTDKEQMNTPEYGPHNVTGRARRVKSNVLLETCNGTSWPAIKDRLLYSHADVIFAQEHRLLAADIADKSAQVKNLGWKVIWAPAVPTDDSNDKRSTSGGVAIFVKKHLGLTHVEDDGVKCPPLVEARLLAGHFTAPGLGSVILYCGYFMCGVGLNSFNKDMIATMHQDAQRRGLPWIFAADWNFEPDTIGNSDLPDLLSAKIKAPTEPTCISPTTAHILDYYLVSSNLAPAITAPTIVDSATSKPHKPVQAEILADLANALVPRFRSNQRLPTEGVYGPRRQPQCYQKAMDEIARAKMAFQAGDFENGMNSFAKGFAEWAMPAEREVAFASDTIDIKKSSRAVKPKRLLLPLLADGKDVKDPPKLGRLNGVLQCLQEVSARLSKAWRCGGKFWVTLSSHIHKACNYTRLNSELNEMDQLKDLIAQHLHDVNTFAATTGADQHDCPAWCNYARLNCTAAAIRKDINGAIEVERARVKKVKDDDWNNWRHNELNGYGSNAHRFTKAKDAWQPPQVRDRDGALVADSPGILNIESEKYGKLWNAKSVPTKKTFANNQPCKKLEPQKLRRVSRTFKKKTGVAPDGWHPRHFALLSDEGLQVLDELFQLLELCGNLPAQQAQVYIFLLDKITGGTRPIGLFTAFYRLWAKARQEEAAKWAGLNDRHYFAAGRNRSTLDPVWRQSIRNQKATTDKLNVATLSWDLRKFYEHVNHDKLRERAVRHNFPLALIDVAINAYRMARVVTYDGLAAEELYPDRGIVAGDSLSDVLVKLYYIDALDDICAKCTVSAIHVYFDDLQVTCIGEPDSIVNNMHHFATLAHVKITDDLECSLAMEKASVTADCPDLCTRLRDALGDIAGPPTSLAAFLGIDELNGRKRSCITKNPNSKWRARQQAAQDKRNRLSRLADGRIAGASNIFVSGTLPAATHGVEVIGISNAELDALRRTALVTMTPKGKARSLAALMVARGDPVWRPAVAPLARWAQEIWLSTAPRATAVDAIPLTELEEVWRAACTKFPRTWNHSRGALDAAVLSAQRIGWKFTSYDTVRTDLGATIRLIETTPKLLNVMLKDAVQRKWQRTMASKLEKNGFNAKRVCPDPIRTVLASAWSRRSPLQAFTALKAFCGGIWTADRARELGYKITDEDAVCPLCKAAPDTLEHRVLHCSARADVRSKHKEAFKVMNACCRSDPLLCFRGIFPHPAEGVELPHANGGIEIQRFDGVDHVDGVPQGLGGDWAFWDGSASRHPVQELRRAAWAVAFLDASGQKQAIISGPVWQNLPQTPQASEHVGAVAAIQTISKPTILVGDCLGVVNTVNKCKWEALPKCAYAGVLCGICNDGQLDNIKECRWTPSHTTLKDNPTLHEQIIHTGNDVVDIEAGERRKEFESRAGDEVLKDAEADCKRAITILKALGDTLAGWPALPKAVERQNDERIGSLRIKHEWSFVAQLDLWRCKACGKFGHGNLAQGPPTASSSCQPGRALLREVRAQQLGHNLATARRAGVPITYCTKCAAHGTWRWNKLLDTCQNTPATVQGQLWLHATKTTGVAPVQLSPKQRAKFDKPVRKKAPNLTKNKGGMKGVGHTDPLKNKIYADAADKANWQPCLRFISRPSRSAQKGKHIAHEEASNAQVNPNLAEGEECRFPATTGADRLEDAYDETQCASCQNTILDTDASCSICGASRDTDKNDTEAKAIKSAGGRAADPVEDVATPDVDMPNTSEILKDSTDDTHVEHQCERCLATILVNDLNCASCGAERSERPPVPDQAMQNKLVKNAHKPETKIDAPLRNGECAKKRNGERAKKVKEPKLVTIWNGECVKHTNKSKSVTKHTVETLPDVDYCAKLSPNINGSQCEVCQAAVPATDIFCVDCFDCGIGGQHNEATACATKSAARSSRKDGQLLAEAAAVEEAYVNPLQRPGPEDDKFQDDHDAERSSTSASSSMPWHGGTLVPPPPPATGSVGSAHCAVDDNNKKRRVSGYTLWSRSHKEQIKSHVTPGAVGIRAYGAAAGQLWRDEDPQIKASFNDLASRNASSSDVAVGPVVVRTQPVAPSVLPSALPSGAESASTELPRRSSDTALDRPAPLQPLSSRPLAKAANKSTLDMSEDEFMPEPGWDGVQASCPEAAPPYRVEPLQRFSRLEALKARVLSRIRAKSTDHNG